MAGVAMSDDKPSGLEVIVWLVLAAAVLCALLAVADCREDDDRAACEKRGGRHVRIENADPTKRAWVCTP